MPTVPQENPNQPSGALTRNPTVDEVVHAVWKLADRPERPSPFGVQWRTPNGRPKLYFRTPELRDEKLAALQRAAGKSEAFTPQDSARARAILDAIGDTPWQDVIAGWREHMKAQGRVPCTVTVKEAVDEYLKHVENLRVSKELCEGTACHKRQKLGLFSQTFGANLLSAVDAGDIEDWIDEQGHASNATFNCYRKHVRSMFEFHRKLVKNPCEHIDTRSESIDHVAILTVPQTAQLFAYALAHNKEALGRLALEAFAGLRFSSAFRLEKEDINYEDKGILLPPHKIKTGRRHYIDELPANLWGWLDKTNAACWAMNDSQWMHTKSELFTDAKVPHPRNCLRHSFCTYHVAAFKNPQLTSTILCHRNTQKLWTNYNGVAKQADGKLYFTITPLTAAKLAKPA
jgi:hypothetical protein